MRFSIIVLLTFSLLSCKEDSNEIIDLRTEDEREQVTSNSTEDHVVHDNVDEAENPPTKRISTISFQIIENEYGFGYQIYDGTTMMINQPHIPAIQGMKGFETREKAEIAAKYVVSEIDKGNFPPTVSEKILRDLGAL